MWNLGRELALGDLGIGFGTHHLVNITGVTDSHASAVPDKMYSVRPRKISLCGYHNITEYTSTVCEFYRQLIVINFYSSDILNNNILYCKVTLKHVN